VIKVAAAAAVTGLDTAMWSARRRQSAYREATKVFGTIVRDWRRRRGLAQEEVAGRAGLSVRTLRKIEKDEILAPRPSTVRLLAEAFGLTGADRDAFYAAAWPAPRRRLAAPAQLPVDPAGFTGRDAELDRLTALLTTDRRRTTVVIAGTAGVGKTSLALHWAHRVKHRFPDGQLYLRLRGFDPGGLLMSPVEALGRLLDALGVGPQRVPADVDGRAALYRATVADRRMLIVLDNVRDAEQVRPLLPDADGCCVLITSRHDLAGLVAVDGAHHLALDLLTADVARRALAGRVADGRVAAEPAAADTIVAACAGLPIALAVAGARAATRPRLPLAALAAELHDTRGRLAALATQDPQSDVRSVFSWSYDALSPDAARLFRLLGLHPGPDVSVAAAASMAGTDPARVRPVLAELVAANLVTKDTAGRFALHDLLWVYAADLAHRTDGDADRRAAIRRMLDHYLHTAYAADRIVSPRRDPLALSAPIAGAHVEVLADRAAALDWFTAEHTVLLAVIHQAAATGWDTHVWQVAWCGATFFEWRGHGTDYAATQAAAAGAARRSGEPAAEAAALRLLAVAELQLGHVTDVAAHLDRALHLSRLRDDAVAQAHTHIHLGVLATRQERRADALAHSLEALRLYESAGHRVGRADALNDVGCSHAALGNHREAVACCRQALELQQALHNRYGEAAAWDSLGYAYRELGDPGQARTCYRHAVDLLVELGDQYHAADAVVQIGEAEHSLGNLDGALEAWRRALTMLDELDHPDADALRERIGSLSGGPGNEAG
jgi:tetratricopeptide (TPR) repeat protein/transcriptional regulator with XRE-family HTH domain